MTRGWQTQGRSARDRRRKKQARAPRTLSEAVKPAAQERAATPLTTTDSSSGWLQTPARVSQSLTIRPEDYGYVYSDLKRIAVLGASIFIVLIALSFVIK